MSGKYPDAEPERRKKTTVPPSSDPRCAGEKNLRRYGSGFGILGVRSFVEERVILHRVVSV